MLAQLYYINNLLPQATQATRSNKQQQMSRVINKMDGGLPNNDQGARWQTRPTCINGRPTAR